MKAFLKPALLAAAMLAPSAVSAASDLATLPRNLSPWGMFLGADIVVQTVMIGLAFASLVTWTVWLSKSIEIRQASAKARRRMMQLDENALSDPGSNAAGEQDAVAQLVKSAAHECRLSTSLVDDGLKERIALRLDRVEQTLARRIARGTGIVATIGATAPFVGLFGTVWGIMNAFIGIAEARTTNLAVVAPGIAEALLATALGLVAAIPAVVIYNQLVRSVTNYRALLGDASATILLIASRDSDRRGARLSQAAE